MCPYFLAYLVLQILLADERKFNKVKSLPQVKWHVNSEVELGFRRFLPLNHKLSSLALPLYRFSHSVFSFYKGLTALINEKSFEKLV